MVMPPVMSHGGLCRVILSGHLLLSMLYLCMGQYKGGTPEMKNLLDGYNKLPFGGGSKGVRLNQLTNIPPPTSLASLNNMVSCEDLEGVGSFMTTCLLNSNLHLSFDLVVHGLGNLEILPHISIVCPIEGCLISFNLTGNIKMGHHASIVAGSVVLSAANLTMESNSCINTTSMGGEPPSQTSGTPVGYDGAGGGHGGRGASCLKNQETNFWGGDVYAWSSLSEPWSYGSKGGGTSDENRYGGNGGGHVKLIVKEILHLNGSVTAEGGDGGKGGGGSGGSIYMHALKLKGFGAISAAGGSGWGGGGGGRISLDCYSIQEDVKITVHGGVSIGCPGNAGAAGTYFDAKLLSLKVGNDNFTTETETPLLDFSTSPLWSNVFVENNAKALVPLRWTRVQVRGQFSLFRGGSIIFGLSEYAVSEFELVAEELLMSDSVIKEYSIISSNTNLGLLGQGHLRLMGHGDAIKAQRLSLSLFYNITIGPGSLLQAPLDDDASKSMATNSQCESQTCPLDLIMPPDDCLVNNTLSFSLQICRVEDLLVNGLIKGSVVLIHRSRTVIVDRDGMITASELGCRNGIGKGNYSNGAGAGAGHGGKGGSGFFDGRISEGGNRYGNADLPCELGSGTEGPAESYGHAAGGGMIVMGSTQWPLLRLDIYGSLRADGQTYGKTSRNKNGSLIGGLGGGSGGSILLFLQALSLTENSLLSVIGGEGGPRGGGGGGGGRVHFHWSKVDTGNEYVPIAAINGAINISGGAGNHGGYIGEEGTITGKKCPKGLYGTFCTECPVGTYKDVEGSDPYLCTPCSLEFLPTRADFIYVRGGVTQPYCPYSCMSDKYRMPNCYTPLEELIYTFGGPIPFALILFCILILLALLLRTLRIKLVRSGHSYAPDTIDNHSHQRSPHLLSLSEVQGTNRSEETQSHVHRMYFMGPNTFREPWHLPYSPPAAIIEIVYEDAFNRFIDEINSVAAYDWWEGSVHSILSVLAYPCAWSWKQWRRKNKIHRLQDYVKSEYDHSCLRSCRSRALYKGMKVGATPDLMVAYIDFFLGGDERRLDMASISSIHKRFPMCILFGGDGSYMSPYNLHSDSLLTNLLSQLVPTSVWNRLVAGLNAQLRTVRHGSIRSALNPVIKWINSHGNPQLGFCGVRMELGWFQATASGYYQLGILVGVGDYTLHSTHHADLSNRSFSDDCLRTSTSVIQKGGLQKQQSMPYGSHSLSRKKLTGGINGGIINEATLMSLDFRRDLFFPVSLLLRNTRPVGRKETLQFLISIMLLADLSVTLLTLVQFYWLSLGAFLAVLLALPLSLLSPFPAGLNALFSKGRRRASLSRVYALWNTTSFFNIGVAFICGTFHGFFPFRAPENSNTWSAKRDDDRWWVMPTILLILKSIQARLVDWHIANLEVPDIALFCPDPDAFWAHESTL
ncbi:hypothetical protein RJ641_035208 [Dillenia turbinata]|uniref:DUF8003 domain-containing protein n=1 Tax=Dillenia turbinata TaxID=194707 RepID=A0AAN8VVT7_9MAGN